MSNRRSSSRLAFGNEPLHDASLIVLSVAEFLGLRPGYSNSRSVIRSQRRHQEDVSNKVAHQQSPDQPPVKSALEQDAGTDAGTSPRSRKMADDYYAWRNENYPVGSSDSGLHTWDNRLTDYSPAKIADAPHTFASYSIRFARCRTASGRRTIGSTGCSSALNWKAPISIAACCNPKRPIRRPTSTNARTESFRSSKRNTTRRETARSRPRLD